MRAKATHTHYARKNRKMEGKNSSERAFFIFTLFSALWMLDGFCSTARHPNSGTENFYMHFCQFISCASVNWTKIIRLFILSESHIFYSCNSFNKFSKSAQFILRANKKSFIPFVPQNWTLNSVWTTFTVTIPLRLAATAKVESVTTGAFAPESAAIESKKKILNIKSAAKSLGASIPD